LMYFVQFVLFGNERLSAGARLGLLALLGRRLRYAARALGHAVPDAAVGRGCSSPSQSSRKSGSKPVHPSPYVVSTLGLVDRVARQRTAGDA